MSPLQQVSTHGLYFQVERLRTLMRVAQVLKQLCKTICLEHANLVATRCPAPLYVKTVKMGPKKVKNPFGAPSGMAPGSSSSAHGAHYHSNSNRESDRETLYLFDWE